MKNRRSFVIAPVAEPSIQSEVVECIVWNTRNQPVSIGYQRDGVAMDVMLRPNESKVVDGVVVASPHFKDLEVAKIIKRIQ